MQHGATGAGLRSGGRVRPSLDVQSHISLEHREIGVSKARFRERKNHVGGDAYRDAPSNEIRRNREWQGDPSTPGVLGRRA